MQLLLLNRIGSLLNLVNFTRSIGSYRLYEYLSTYTSARPAWNRAGTRVLNLEPDMKSKEWSCMSRTVSAWQVPYWYRTGTRAGFLPSPTSNFWVYTCPDLALLGFFSRFEKNVRNAALNNLLKTYQPSLDARRRSTGRRRPWRFCGYAALVVRLRRGRAMAQKRRKTGVLLINWPKEQLIFATFVTVY
jgi:hypothetical protein